MKDPADMLTSLSVASDRFAALIDELDQYADDYAKDRVCDIAAKALQFFISEIDRFERFFGKTQLLVNNFPEYGVWSTMKDRCGNKNNKSYSYYGGRGIVVDERWSKSFINFIKDMGWRPSKNHSLDRMNNNGNYCKSNCRWVTESIQAANKGRIIKNPTGYEDVYSRGENWQASVTFNKIRTHLGTFECKHKAAMAREVHKEINNIPPYGNRRIYEK